MSAWASPASRPPAAAVMPATLTRLGPNELGSVRYGPAGLLDEPNEGGVEVVEQLGMPLHRDDPRSLSLDHLDDAVRCSAEDDEAITQLVDRLVVERVDGDLVQVAPAERGGRVDLD